MVYTTFKNIAKCGKQTQILSLPVRRRWTGNWTPALMSWGSEDRITMESHLTESIAQCAVYQLFTSSSRQRDLAHSATWRMSHRQRACADDQNASNRTLDYLNSLAIFFKRKWRRIKKHVYHPTLQGFLHYSPPLAREKTPHPPHLNGDYLPWTGRVPSA